MQDIILILSRCQTKRLGHKSRRTFFKFHFKGFYHGIKIKEIHVYPCQPAELGKGEDYLLWVRFKNIKNLILEVELLKHKKI